jgi:hypothetical protein
MDERRVRFQGKQTRFLLGLGIALVLLAGIIFVSTTWNTLTELAKIGMIAGMTGVFAGSSWYTKSRLRLENTGEAFYVLAQLFTGITLAALWAYHFLWESATLEFVGFLYICWLAAWGLKHPNRLLNKLFFAVGLWMIIYRWIFNRPVGYPVAVVAALYIFLSGIKHGKTAINRKKLYGNVILTMLCILGMIGRNAGFSCCMLLAVQSFDRAGAWEGDRRRAALTWMVWVLCGAFYIQNFFKIQGVMEVELYLLPVAVFTWALSPIWNRPGEEHRVEYMQFLLIAGCLMILGGNALHISDTHLEEKLFHTVVMAGICLSMVLLSTHFRSTTGSDRYIKWQVLGAAGLMGVILKVTWSFWASLGWWVYLLAVGAALIAVAAVKEVRDREQEE